MIVNVITLSFFDQNLFASSPHRGVNLLMTSHFSLDFVFE